MSSMAGQTCGGRAHSAAVVLPWQRHKGRCAGLCQPITLHTISKSGTATARKQEARQSLQLREASISLTEPKFDPDEAIEELHGPLDYLPDVNVRLNKRCQ